MSGSLTINGMMIFFVVAILAAAAAPLLLLPKWLERAQARRAAFHADAIAVLTAEMARPQAPGQLKRVAANRQFNIAALRALAPHITVPPLNYKIDYPLAA